VLTVDCQWFAINYVKGANMESFQQLRVYPLAEKISNEIWFIVKKRDDFAKDTRGQQIVRSADSVGANIAEGHGRYSYQNHQRFVKIA
jgi:four helix bundle protein